jgi:hypothetical protein
VPIETRPYTIPHLRFAYLAAEEYVRTFWFFVVAVPLGGVVLLLTGERTLQAIGFFAVLWPMSIPARAILITRRASKLFSRGVVMRSGAEGVEFVAQAQGANGKRLRMAVPKGAIRGIVVRQGVLLLRTYRQQIAPIAPDAFANDADREAFVRWTKDAPDDPPGA